MPGGMADNDTVRPHFPASMPVTNEYEVEENAGYFE